MVESPNCMKRHAHHLVAGVMILPDAGWLSNAAPDGSPPAGFPLKRIPGRAMADRTGLRHKPYF